MRKLEQKYLDLNVSNGKTYNMSKSASGGDLISYHPRRDVIVAKMRRSLMVRYRNMPKEERSSKYGRSGRANGNFGNGAAWTPQMRQKAADKMRKQQAEGFFGLRYKGCTNVGLFGEEKAEEISEKLSAFAKTRTGDKNPFYGKKHTEEYKERMSKERKGKYRGKQNRPVSVLGVVYRSAGEAGKALGSPMPTVRHRCLSEKEKFKQWFFVETA